MPGAPQDTWRSKLSGSADRRGVNLATIFVTTLVVIGLVDLNVALIVGIWVLRTIVLYMVVAFFIALLMTPATRFLKRRGMSHGGRDSARVPDRRTSSSSVSSTCSSRRS